jgi:serine/threonine protein kinase
MAEVWEGHDQVLSRPVALKVLQRQYATDEVFLERFRREAIAAARLAHPGVVATFDAGADGDITYIVMELVRGTTLRHYSSERGPLAPWLVVGIALQITDALLHAHNAGIIHRDIKPANILLCEEGNPVPRVKVTDFGIAKAAERSGLDLTRTGMVVGTPRYLSPEQVKGVEPDARADLYALGVVMFEMLTGSSPFEGTTEMSMALARLNQPAPRVRRLRPDVPRRLDALVGELLAGDPADRPPSAAVLYRNLSHLQESLPPPKRQPAPSRSLATTATGWRSGAGDRPRSAPSPAGHRNGSNPAPRPPQPPPSRLRPGPAPPGRRRRRAPRGPAMVVGGLALAGLVVAGLLMSGGPRRSQGSQSAGRSSAITISSVKVWIVPPMRTPDFPNLVRFTYDGNPRTYWHTVGYYSANFGGYGGEGLAIHLDGVHTLRQLQVTSISQGWAASTYVANSEGSTLAAWGPPTDSRSRIPGSTTFSLGGRRGSWVLLWMTNTGPKLTLDINELVVR